MTTLTEIWVMIQKRYRTFLLVSAIENSRPLMFYLVKPATVSQSDKLRAKRMAWERELDYNAYCFGQFSYYSWYQIKYAVCGSITFGAATTLWQTSNSSWRMRLLLIPAFVPFLIPRSAPYIAHKYHAAKKIAAICGEPDPESNNRYDDEW